MTTEPPWTTKVVQAIAAVSYVSPATSVLLSEKDFAAVFFASPFQTFQRPNGEAVSVVPSAEVPEGYLRIGSSENLDILDVWRILNGQASSRFSRVLVGVSDPLIDLSLIRDMKLELPPSHGPEREKAILSNVSKGLYEVTWVPIRSKHGDHEAEFYVSADALKIGGVRFNVTATTQQQIADRIGASLLTPKLADLLHAQAEIKIGPKPRRITSTTAAMFEHSAAVDAAIVKAAGSLQAAEGKLVSTVGKHWCISEELRNVKNRALNYGWHFLGSTFEGVKGYPCDSRTLDPVKGISFYVIQPSATAHDPNHSDYSQVCVLVMQVCNVDGKQMLLSDVLRNPELAPLASHEGVMTILRQPGVPEPTDKTIVLPEVVVPSRFDRDPSV